MYRVFESGKRCDNNYVKGFVGKDTFSLKRNAEVYAYMWVHSCSLSYAESEMCVGVEYDFSGCGKKFFQMKIEEV